MRENKRRVETNPTQAPLAGLDAGFAHLALPADLPTGPPDQPPASPSAAPLWKLGRVVLRREKARRGGKTVVVIDDFATHLPLSVIEAVAKRVRVACGCGGTVKERRVEIQGDDAGKIRAVLEGEGFQVAGVR